MSQNGMSRDIHEFNSFDSSFNILNQMDVISFLLISRFADEGALWLITLIEVDPNDQLISGSQKVTILYHPMCNGGEVQCHPRNMSSPSVRGATPTEWRRHINPFPLRKSLLVFGLYKMLY
ncbi:hypothetical protein PoB_002570700 [Plakobranchus ocellatus]|uniref:Uncharacterized protein n=1 Tax=Plakobranchus ocellatus TaxID=259542 RepID=A0AAV3ZXB2_9GAST|nr:hypothetical protein PoB_002570700 [Plakobranchus ocellatus]